MNMPIAVSVLTVLRVEERHVKTHVSGVGKEAIFNEDSLGWFVLVDGNIAIRVVPPHGDPPDVKPGDRVRLTLERA